ncbi:IS3 family transposase [Collinsella ihumii]|uniref:IS3 family transposase n=1 Tax=Collinsella ihumii TaxID=1720204 RepID=UPI0008378FEE|nr:IS3 family transposase [Collinsella ihumii]
MSETCRALHVTRQGCCAWRNRRPSGHDERDAELAGRISEICAAGRGIYGAPKVLAELRRAGEPASRRRLVAAGKPAALEELHI